MITTEFKIYAGCFLNYSFYYELTKKRHGYMCAMERGGVLLKMNSFLMLVQWKGVSTGKVPAILPDDY